MTSDAVCTDAAVHSLPPTVLPLCLPGKTHGAAKSTLVCCQQHSDQPANVHACPLLSMSACMPSQVLQRGEKIELLVDKVDDLQHQAQAFQKQGRKLHTRMW